MKIPKVAHEASYIPPDEVRRLMMREGNWIVSGTTVYRKDRWIEAGGVRSDLEGFGDEFLVTVLAMRYGACFVPKPFLAWRRVDTSYAGRMNSDLPRVQAIAATSEQLMLTKYADVFPPGYPQRWRQRWVFGAEHYILKQKYLRNSGVAIWQQRLRWIGYCFRAIALFVRMRPFDILPVLRRWASHAQGA